MTHFFQTDQNPAEGTFTTLRMIRLKSPINWPEGSSISFSSWSTDLCCRPIPKRRAWRTGNLLERLRGQALAREMAPRTRVPVPWHLGQNISWHYSGIFLFILLLETPLLKFLNELLFLANSCFTAALKVRGAPGALMKQSKNQSNMGEPRRMRVQTAALLLANCTAEHKANLRAEESPPVKGETTTHLS